jgi:hypothetical protein
MKRLPPRFFHSRADRLGAHGVPIVLLGMVVVSLVSLSAPAFARNPPLRILTNQVGYDVRGSKKLIVQIDREAGADVAAKPPAAFQVVDDNDRVAVEGPLTPPTNVDGWKRGTYLKGDFSKLAQAGTYRARISGKDGMIWSQSFAVKPDLLPETCSSNLMFYFKSQRCSGVYDQADRKMTFFGQKRAPIDVHGGWYDASGDVSKYLSHLSYANFMNPQQTPAVVWSFLESRDLLADKKSKRLQSLRAMYAEEALHGADFLVRMQDPAGYFYATVFDNWSADVSKREIASYKTQEGHKNTEYQAAFREGGGMTIAALARVSSLGRKGDYAPARYLSAAEKGFAHLQAHNLEYVDDHKENIIDDYCALMAATELFAATKKPAYLKSARQRRAALIERLHKDQRFTDFWRADADGRRSYFHGAEAGLPVLALLRYRAIEPDAASREQAMEAISRSLAFELTVTREVANPFGYARQYVTELDGNKHSAFFLPHGNESGYWWQGENARLGSLAAAAFLAARQLGPQAGDRRSALAAYGTDQLDWILGLNPFDMCMLQGKGRNNPEYEQEQPNAPGGVCNGITSGFSDEHDIAFQPLPQANIPDQNWRWSEQWLLHAAWLGLAMAAQSAALAP